jgi:drug/metabolite transporter, DME family
LTTTRLTSRLHLLAAAALFSTGGAAIKATTLTSWQVASFRSGIAALTILLLVPAARRGWSWRVGLVAVAYATTLTLFVVSNKLTTSANAIFLQSSAPVYVLFLSPWLLREPLRRQDLLFMLVVGLGLALFFVGNEPPVATAPNPRLGNFLAMGSGVAWALTVVGLRWLGSQGGGDAAFATVAAGNVIAFLACLPLALPVTGATSMDWAVVAYLGIFQIGLAYLFLTSGIRHVPALETSVILLVEPAINPVWAALLHGEIPSRWSIAGGFLILGATMLKTWFGIRRPPPLRAPHDAEGEVVDEVVERGR